MQPERSSAASPARAAARSMPRVDPRPRRVQLDEPLEQRRLLREPARGPLVEVVVAVDQPGRREAAGRVDPRAVAAARRAGPDGGDPVALDDDVPVLVDGAADGRDRAAFDDHGPDQYDRRTAARRVEGRSGSATRPGAWSVPWTGLLISGVCERYRQVTGYGESWLRARSLCSPGRRLGDSAGVRRRVAARVLSLLPSPRPSTSMTSSTTAHADSGHVVARRSRARRGRGSPPVTPPLTCPLFAPAAPRRGSSRSPCSGTGCRPAPRGSPASDGDGLRASRSCVATIRPGVQNPHCTAPASRNASWIGCSSSSAASPSTVTTSRPSACPAATRHEHTSAPSR